MQFQPFAKIPLEESADALGYQNPGCLAEPGVQERMQRCWDQPNITAIMLVYQILKCVATSGHQSVRAFISMGFSIPFQPLPAIKIDCRFVVR